MDKQKYLNTLKKLELRPGKVKVKEFNPKILNEQGDNGLHDLHMTIKQWFLKNPNPKDSQIRVLAKEIGMSEDELEEHIYMILTKLLQRVDINEAKKLNELFVKTKEIEDIPAGAERDMQILRLAMIAELDASNLYEKLALLANDQRVSKVLLDISQEEKVHAGEFETLLEEIDPEYEKAEEEGEKEVGDLLGI